MRIFLFFFTFNSILLFAHVQLGIDTFLKDGMQEKFKNKKVALITNHTGVNANLKTTYEILQNELNLVAVFSPEHGFNGLNYAGENVEADKSEKIKFFSLHGKTKRPTAEMFKNIDVLIYDIQEIGCRAYTYASTLFYCMEEAARQNIKVIVLDRPNPINGNTIDGPMLDENIRSILGYINVPYCHGMTIGELALFFNGEYKVGCEVEVVKMKGWKREMSFSDTELVWIPTSPNIPEEDTPFYCATTGIIGELELANIGIGYTLPFKIVGAPWIDAKKFAEKLNAQNFLGVFFVPFCFKPFYGLYKGENCQGVKIIITNKNDYHPVTVQYLILGVLKSLYPNEFEKRISKTSNVKRKIFNQVIGNAEMFDSLLKDKYVTWKFISFHEEERKAFLEKRKKYLLY